jgi:two-component system, OmpR family, KDP operon response regulator KdpE
MSGVSESPNEPRTGAGRGSRRAGTRVLLVEDDQALARIIQRRLGRHTFSVETVASVRDARHALERLRPELVLLDLDVADGSGRQFIREVRTRGAVPVIAIETRRAERDTVEALELGADDVVVKPFGVDELFARIRVALRHLARPAFGAEPVIRVGNLEVDIERRRVVRAGRPIHLTPTEYELLKLLATHPDRFLSDRLLMDEVWGPGWRGGEHILHVYMARLRKKIENNPSSPRLLLTESGLGYRLATGTLGTRDARARTALAS